MKFTCEVVIDRPVADVIRLFDNPDNMSKWQPELVSFTPISGTPGEVGAKSKLIYTMGKRTIGMIETITVRDLPREFSGTYEADGVFNVVKNYFHDQGTSTKWISENEFQFKGFMKVIGFLFPGAFRKTSQKYMDQFKAFAESEG